MTIIITIYHYSLKHMIIVFIYIIILHTLICIYFYIVFQEKKLYAFHKKN